MADDAPEIASDGRSTGSQPQQRPSIPRNRLNSRTPTMERSNSGFQQPPGLKRRRSSMFSEFSMDEARNQIRSTTDDLFLPRPAKQGHDLEVGTSHWHSIPLLFALLPAIGGMMFKNGSHIVTDILLLSLAAVFLNWSVRLPWHWYHDTQAVKIPENLEDSTSTILEEDEEDDETESDATTKTSDRKKTMPSGISRSSQRVAAASELRAQELAALLFCFIGPMFGAYLMHAIRAQLSRPSEGLVSNYNLSIFLLAAELRPCAHLIKLMQARTLHLQRVVRSSGNEKVDQGQLSDINKRLGEMEAHVADITTKNPMLVEGASATSSDVEKQVRNAFQPQVDALNRAVRRYEKRAAAQTMQTEARLQDLENRLRDALSLAAAAAHYSQRPGWVPTILEWTATAFMLPLQGMFALTIYPFQLGYSMLFTAKNVAFGQSKSPPEKGKKRQGRSADHSGISRVRSGSGRR